MRLQRMLGHLPALLLPRPRSVLVVGCGAGVTAGSFLAYSQVTNVTICEIEPLIPEKIAPYFTNENYDVVHDPRVKIIIDDARHFVLTSREKFDIITSDPIHPWVKGAATLYTRDYFQLCKEHLNPGGIVTQWVPLYESDLPAVKSEMATFFEVFPNGTIWDNDDTGAGYDTVLLGTVEPLKIDLDQMQARWQRQPAVAQSLKDVGFRNRPFLVRHLWRAGRRLTTLAGRRPDQHATATCVCNIWPVWRRTSPKPPTLPTASWPTANFPTTSLPAMAPAKMRLRLILEAKIKKQPAPADPPAAP